MAERSAPAQEALRGVVCSCPLTRFREAHALTVGGTELCAQLPRDSEAKEEVRGAAHGKGC